MTDVAEIARSLTKAQRWIVGYEGLYFVDDKGEVYSVPRTFDRLNRGTKQTVRVRGGRLVKTLNRNGYPFVRLNKQNSAKTREVHRLVCIAFHGPPQPGQEAAHNDGNKLNCAPDNLRWTTRSDNMRDKRITGTMLVGEQVPNSKLTTAQAVDIFRRCQSRVNQRQLARDYGVSEKTIRKIKRGEMWADFTSPSATI